MNLQPAARELPPAEGRVLAPAEDFSAVYGSHERYLPCIVSDRVTPQGLYVSLLHLE